MRTTSAKTFMRRGEGMVDGLYLRCESRLVSFDQ